MHGGGRGREERVLSHRSCGTLGACLNGSRRRSSAGARTSIPLTRMITFLLLRCGTRCNSIGLCSKKKTKRRKAMCISCDKQTEKFTKFHYSRLRGMLSTTAESPWFSFWKSGSLLDLSGSRMELSGEIGPGERRLIYSGLDPSAQWAEGTEATRGSHPRNIFLRTLKDRPNAPQPGRCFLSFISWPFSFPATIFSRCCNFFLTHHPFRVGCMALFEFHWIRIASKQERTYEIHQEPI